MDEITEGTSLEERSQQNEVTFSPAISSTAESNNVPYSEIDQYDHSENNVVQNTEIRSRGNCTTITSNLSIMNGHDDNTISDAFVISNDNIETIGMNSGNNIESNIQNSDINEESENTSQVHNTNGHVIDIDDCEFSSSSSSDSSDTESDDEDSNDSKEQAEKVEKYVKEAMQKKKPNCQNIIKQLHLRDNGYHKPGAQELFTRNVYNSLYVAESLHVVDRLAFHKGCVNSVSFNENGSLMVSGSDDLKCALWNFNSNKPITSFHTEHTSNIFQSKFLPVNDSTILTCAKDGHVRCITLKECGKVGSNVSVARHKSEAKKLTSRPHNPYELLSCGADAIIKNIDVRRQNSRINLVEVRGKGGEIVPLNSVSYNPLNNNQFCVAGNDETVRVYDTRIISGRVNVPVLNYTPDKCKDKGYSPSVTCAVYSDNADAILATYSEDEIYLFDTSKFDSCPPAHVYTGHRNSDTIKAVSFFGPNSRFIISGSDCGNILCWDRETESIVNYVEADAYGAINVLEPHPYMPILAASGLDNDVKILMPGKKKSNFLETIQDLIKRNFEERESERDSTNNYPLSTILEFISSRRNILGGFHLDFLTNNDEDEDMEDIEFGSD